MLGVTLMLHLGCWLLVKLRGLVSDKLIIRRRHYVSKCCLGRLPNQGILIKLVRDRNLLLRSWEQCPWYVVIRFNRGQFCRWVPRWGWDVLLVIRLGVRVILFKSNTVSRRHNLIRDVTIAWYWFIHYLLIDWDAFFSNRVYLLLLGSILNKWILTDWFTSNEYIWTRCIRYIWHFAIFTV